MTTKPDKPSKAELLDELESIRRSLLPEDDVSVAPMELSTEDIVSPAELAKTQKVSVDEPHSPNPSPEPHKPQTPPLAQTATPLDLDKDTHMKPLPGQQSLFDEDAKKKNDAEATKIETIKPATTNTDTKAPKRRPQAKPAYEAQTQEPENPFLPHHMKRRLEKEKLLYQQSAQHNSTAKVSATATATATADDNEALVDELVGIYLPKIEQELRQRLRERLKQDKQD